MNTSVQVDESHAQAIRRLLAKARQDGIKLYRDAEGRHYASSTSEPARLHYVTGYSCDCRGFARHQRCKHHAALLSALGWLPGDPAPDPDTESRIELRHTDGHDEAAGWLVSNGAVQWVEPLTTIVVDGAERFRIEGEQFTVRACWLDPRYLPSSVTADLPAGLDHAAAVRFLLDFLQAGPQTDALLRQAGLLDTTLIAA